MNPFANTSLITNEFMFQLQGGLTFCKWVESVKDTPEGREEIRLHLIRLRRENKAFRRWCRWNGQIVMNTQ